MRLKRKDRGRPKEIQECVVAQKQRMVGNANRQMQYNKD